MKLFESRGDVLRMGGDGDAGRWVLYLWGVVNM